MTARNQEVSGAARLYIQRVMALLWTHCPPPEGFQPPPEPDWRLSQWVRRDGNIFERVPPPATLSGYWLSCYHHSLPELEASPEYAALVTALEADTTVQPQLGAMVGTLSHLRRLDRAQVVNALVWGTIEANPSPEWDGGGWGAAIGGNSSSPVIDSNLFTNNSCDSQFDSGVVGL